MERERERWREKEQAKVEDGKLNESASGSISHLFCFSYLFLHPPNDESFGEKERKRENEKENEKENENCIGKKLEKG